MENEFRRAEEIITSFGLTNFEAKVYLTLFTQGPMSPPQLAKVLAKHRPQVYTTLTRLLEKGWVEKLNGKPSLFRAVNPEIVFKVVLNDLEKKVEYLLNELKAVSKVTKEERYGVWILRSFETIMQKAEDVLENAKVDAIISGNVRFIKRLQKQILDAQKRGVNVYILVFTYKGEKLNPEDFKAFKKAKWAVSGDLISLADSEVGVLIKQRREYRSIEYGLVLEEPAVIDYVLHDFFYRWTRSRTLRDTAVKLPSSFTMHRFAILEAKKLLREGARIRVRVKGRDIVSGNNVEIDGELIRCELSLRTGLANLKVKVDGKEVLVGGPDAVVEDIAAYYIQLY